MPLNGTVNSVGSWSYENKPKPLIWTKMASDLRLKNVTRDDSARWYRVSVDNGFEGTYPYVWLRDNCRCTQCYHPSSCQRASLMADLDPDVTPSSETLIDEGRVLSVVWPDQHRSDFDAEWLNRQRFSDSERDVVDSPDLQTWGDELNGNIPTFEFEKLLQDDMELYNWLSVLNTKGLAVVKGATTEKGAGRKLAEKVAYLKPTSNGVEFQVFCKNDACNIAYTGNALGLHVDMPYRYYIPGIQMLHCIAKTSDVEGGENQFVDGMLVAEQIKKESPESYKLLTTREVDFIALGSDYVRGFIHKTTVPTIQVSRNGDFQQINYNDPVRAPCMSLPVGEVTEMYRALKLFNDVMYRPANLVRHQLAPGEMVTFNNIRALHARSAYTITGNGSRQLEGGYIDWDEAHSRMRVLQKNLFVDGRV